MNDRLQSNQREYLNFTSHILFISIYYIKQTIRENIKISKNQKQKKILPFLLEIPININVTVTTNMISSASTAMAIVAP